MAFDIIDMNLDPNQKWFVRFDDLLILPFPRTFLVALFNTLADAQAVTARVAFAVVDFDPNSPLSMDVVLTADSTLPAFGGVIAKFNDELSYMLIVSGVEGDPSKIFSVGPFTELPTIEDALMVTEAMIQDRATVELNLGTHTAVRRSLQVKEHTVALDEGDIVTYASSRRSIAAVKQQIVQLSIVIRQNDDGSVDFHDELELVEWQDFNRV